MSLTLAWRLRNAHVRPSRAVERTLNRRSPVDADHHEPDQSHGTRTSGTGDPDGTRSGGDRDMRSDDERSPRDRAGADCVPGKVPRHPAKVTVRSCLRIYAPVIALLVWVALIVLFCRPGSAMHAYCGWLKPTGLALVASAVFLHTKEM